MSIDLTRDAARFLAAAASHLAADPVLSTVVASTAERTVRESAAGRPPPPEDWWAVVRDDAGAVVGAAMRTAPFAPRPPYVLAMPDEAARALARLLHERGEDVEAANGSLPAARVLLEEVARLAGGTVEVLQHTRLLQLASLAHLVEPRAAPGHLRAARLDEAPLCTRWFAAFGDDADEQAGRAPGTGYRDGPDADADAVRRRVEAGLAHVWEDAGEVVHLTVTRPPAYGVVGIGPVYTPPEHRGRGYAASAVAAVSRRLLQADTRPCLVTDLANPTSTRLYTTLGYERVADLANLVRAGGAQVAPGPT